MYQSVMKHDFSNVPDVKLKRSVFDRTSQALTTMNSGYLYPVYFDDILPGDTVNMSISHFARLSSALKPVMTNLYLDAFVFFVPWRLVWDNFVKMMGEQVDPGDSVDYTMPLMDTTKGVIAAAGGGYPAESLSDYLRLPIGVEEFTHHCLNHRVYNKIWNDWFRDENLQDSVVYGNVANRDDGPDDERDYVLLRRGKRHDYFTSCQPYPYKENDLYPNGVTLPLGTEAPLKVDIASGGDLSIRNNADDLKKLDRTAATYLTLSGVTGSSTDEIYADLSNATAATIDEFILAMQIQALLRIDARGGTRYIEMVRAHFGVVSSDSRLQRAEFIYSCSTPINFHSVPNTSPIKAADAPQGVDVNQGDLTAFGTVSDSKGGFIKSFEEHGTLMILVNIRSDQLYQSGCPREYRRTNRFTIFHPVLNNLGEQAVETAEIFCNGNAAPGAILDTTTFGYQERWSEYRYKPSWIGGQFKSQYATPLDAYHTAIDFGDPGDAPPELNDSFIQENPPLTRNLVTTPHFLYNAEFQLRHVRVMGVNSIPADFSRL